MTGRDVPTRQKTLSVAFSVIMVLSMVAAGMAGFAGSAAATDAIDSGNAEVVLSSANSDEQVSAHVIRVNVTGTSLSDTVDLSAGNANLTINYDQDVGLTQTVDGSSSFDDFGTGTDEIQGDSSVQVYLGAQNELETDGNYDITPSVTNSSIELDLSNADANNVLAANEDIITIVLTNDADNTNTSLTSPASSSNVTVSVDAGGNQATFEEKIEVDSDAPIQRSDGEAHHTIENALEGVSATGAVALSGENGASSDDIIAVEQDITLEDDPANEVHDGLSVGTSNVTIQGSNNQTVSIDNSNLAGVGDNSFYVGVGTNSQFTLNDLTLVDETGNINALQTGNNANDLTITSTTLSGFGGDGGNAGNGQYIEIAQGNSINNLTFTDNQLSGSATNGVLAEASINGNNGEFVAIERNTIDITGANTGLDLTIDEDTSAGTISIDGNTINGDNTATSTGILLAGTHTNLDVDNTVVDKVSNGIDLGGGGQSFINVTTATLTNISNAGVQATGDLDDAAEVTIDDLTVDDSSNGIGINIGDADSQYEITASSLNDTNRGVDIGDAEEVTVRGSTTIDNTNNQAIRINNPTDGTDSTIVVNESTSIDQAGTGVEVNVDADTDGTVDIDNINVNGTTSGVDIVGVDTTANTGTAVNVTSSTFTNNNGAGLNVSTIGAATDALLNVHFNTFESNNAGIGFDAGAYDGTFNATFNDIAGNNAQGLEVQNIAGGVVNANYSWWDNRDSSRIVGPYTPQNAESQLPIPRRVYSYTRLHTGGQP